MQISCPICQKELIKDNSSYVCENKHCFDIAREGYLNLNRNNSQKCGDNKEMIRARESFLNAGYYAFLKDKINELLSKNDIIVDLACGEGYYTSQFKGKGKVGIDLSKSGLKIASKNDKDSLYLLCSIFHTPLFGKCCDKVITIFAPLADKEIVRILKDQGQFIFVKPDVRHLWELKAALYDEPYLNIVEQDNIEGLKLIKTINISQQALLNQQQLMNLFIMTPYYNTTSDKDKEKLTKINELKVSFAFVIEIFTKI